MSGNQTPPESLFSDMPETMPCERCTGVERVLQDGAYYCPCCKSRLKTAEMVQRQGEQRAAEMGLTLDEYSDYCASLIRKEPPSEAEMARLQAFARQREAEWKPACEHDTSNPWR